MMEVDFEVHFTSFFIILKVKFAITEISYFHTERLPLFCYFLENPKRGTVPLKEGQLAGLLFLYNT